MASTTGNIVDLTLEDDNSENDIYFIDTEDLPDIGVSSTGHSIPLYKSSTASIDSNANTIISNNDSCLSSSHGYDATDDKDRRKRERESERLRKLAEKEERARQREEKRRQKEGEKAERANARIAVKSKRPGECLKYITVILEQSLLNTSLSAKLLAFLQESEIRYRFEEFTLEKLICWQREMPCDSQSSSVDETDEETQALIIVPVQDFVRHVNATVKGGDDVITLDRYVSQLQDNLPPGGKVLTLAIQGIEKYFRDVKTLNQRQYRQNIIQNASGENGATKKSGKKLQVDTVISRLELEQTLVALELESTVNLKFVETDEEMAKLVLMLTKAVAETPFKRSRQDVDFAFLPDNKNTVKVGKDGEGLRKLWINQFLQFHNVSPDVATAIVGEFPSVRALVGAYENAPTSREAELLLADIRVRRGAGVLETTRRIGKELSKRVYAFMTCEDPSFLLK